MERTGIERITIPTGGELIGQVLSRAIRAALESTDFESAVRLAISFGDVGANLCIRKGGAALFLVLLLQEIMNEFVRVLPQLS